MGFVSRQAKYFKKNGQIDRKKELDYCLVKYSGYEIVRSQVLGSIYYAAIRTPVGEICGLVVETSLRMKELHNFLYKEIPEDSEPKHYDCPKGILKLLSPTTNKKALAWREECWKKQKKESAFGKFKRELDALKTGTEIQFGKGYAAVTLKKNQYGKWYGDGGRWSARNMFNYSNGEYKVKNIKSVD